MNNPLMKIKEEEEVQIEIEITSTTTDILLYKEPDLSIYMNKSENCDFRLHQLIV